MLFYSRVSGLDMTDSGLGNFTTGEKVDTDVARQAFAARQVITRYQNSFTAIEKVKTM
jgi:hypothetical protein